MGRQLQRRRDGCGAGGREKGKHRRKQQERGEKNQKRTELKKKGKEARGEVRNWKKSRGLYKLLSLTTNLTVSCGCLYHLGFCKGVQERH